MKRFSAFLVLLVMILAFGLVLASCDSNDSGSGGGGGGSGGGGGQSASIVGTWRAYNEDGDPITLVFRSNGTFKWSDLWGDEEGEYWANGNTVTLSIGGMEVSGKLNGNTFSIAGFNFTRL